MATESPKATATGDPPTTTSTTATAAPANNGTPAAFLPAPHFAYNGGPIPFPHGPIPGPYPPFYSYPPPDPSDPNAAAAVAPHYVMFPPPMAVYAAFPQPPPGQGFAPQSLPVPTSPSNGTTPKIKRRQVKMACTNCAQACKRCDDIRPCERCLKYGIADSCVDGQRKERKKGVKRGPYKRKAKTEDGGVGSEYNEYTPPENDWSASPTASTSAGAAAPPSAPAPPEGFYYPHGYPTLPDGQPLPIPIPAPDASGQPVLPLPYYYAGYPTPFALPFQFIPGMPLPPQPQPAPTSADAAAPKEAAEQQPATVNGAAVSGTEEGTTTKKKPKAKTVKKTKSKAAGESRSNSES